MLHRILQSLTKPPHVVFFLKDSWLRIALYFFMMPFILILPAILDVFINPGMPIGRYSLMTQTIYQDLLETDAKIEEGRLLYTTPTSVTFDTIDLNIGRRNNPREIIAFTFTEDALVLSIGQMTYLTKTYVELGLESFDFSLKTIENAQTLSQTIRLFYNEATIIDTFEVILLYFLRMIDFLIIVLIVPLAMLLIFRHHPLTYLNRLKLSIYLSTIWVFVELFITLIGQPALGFLSLLALYIYHLWAYRSIIVIDKGGKTD